MKEEKERKGDTNYGLDIQNLFPFPLHVEPTSLSAQDAEPHSAMNRPAKQICRGTQDETRQRRHFS